jgi:hypothetical protein
MKSFGPEPGAPIRMGGGRDPGPFFKPPGEPGVSRIGESQRREEGAPGVAQAKIGAIGSRADQIIVTLGEN